MEAIAAGLPVIATTAGALPEILEDSKTGILIPPENPSRLAKAILLLLNKDPDHAEETKFDRSCIIQKYAWDKSVESFLAYYRKCEINV